MLDIAPGSASSYAMTQHTVLSVFLARVFLYTPFVTVAGCIPVLIEDWGIGAAKASSIVSAFYFTYAFSLLGFSWLGDHIGAKRSVLISACATAGACAAFALLAKDFTTTLVLYGLIGLCQGGVYTPLIVLFRENARPENLGTSIGWLISSTSVGYAASIALTGLCIGLSGWRLAFIVTGLLPVVGLALLLAAIRPLPNRVHTRRRGVGVIKELKGNPTAQGLVAGYTFHNWELLGMWAWAPALIAASFVLAGETTIAATQWSAHFITALHLCGATAAFTMGHLSDRLGRRRVLIVITVLGMAMSFVVGWFVASPPVLVATLVVIYSFFALGDSPVLSTALAEAVPPAYLGGVLAIRSLIGFLVGAISPVVVGWVIDTLRAQQASEPVVWGMGFATLGVGGIIAVYFARRLPVRLAR